MERPPPAEPQPNRAGPGTRPGEAARAPPGRPPPGPPPAETDALAGGAIDEAAQRRRCAGARGLNGFVRDAHAHVTPRGDERTNVVDQGGRVTYALGREPLAALFRALEACRLEGSATHFSERQGTAAAPRSGLMLDFDITTAERRPALADRHYYRLAGALVAALQRDVDFAAQLPPEPGGRRPAEARLHVFFTVKPEAVPVDGAAAGAGPVSSTRSVR